MTEQTANETVRLLKRDAELRQLKKELRSWRELAYNASQMVNAASYGRCKQNVERLERKIDRMRRVT